MTLSSSLSYIILIVYSIKKAYDRYKAYIMQQEARKQQEYRTDNSE